MKRLLLMAVLLAGTIAPGPVCSQSGCGIQPIKPITVQPPGPILPGPKALAEDAGSGGERGRAGLSEEDVAALQDLIANSDF